MAFQKALSHICIVLCGMFITFFIVDRYNPGMEFINNPITKALLLIFSLLVLIQSVIKLMGIREKERAHLKRGGRTR